MIAKREKKNVYEIENMKKELTVSGGMSLDKRVY